MVDMDRQPQDGRSNTNKDNEPAQALRFYACAISASARDFQRVWHDSAAQNGAHDRDDTAPPPTISALTVDFEPGDSRRSVLLPRGSSLRDWLEKLADARRKWMVATYRFSNGKQSVDKSPKRDDRRQTYESARAKKGSLMIASDQSGRQPPWGNPLKHTIVRAADFCRRCDSMVEVELQYAAQGVFVAERRKKCPVCNSEEQLRGSNMVGTKRSPRADSDERFEVGRDWRPKEVRKASRHQWEGSNSRQTSKPPSDASRISSSSSNYWKRPSLAIRHQDYQAIDSSSITDATHLGNRFLAEGNSSRRGDTATKDVGRQGSAQAVFRRMSTSIPIECSVVVRPSDQNGDKPCLVDTSNISGDESADQHGAYYSGGVNPTLSNSTFQGHVALEMSAARPTRRWTRESIRLERKSRKKQEFTAFLPPKFERGGENTVPGNLSTNTTQGADSRPAKGSADASTYTTPESDKGTLAANGDLAEEIKLRDEQIRVLKQQLTALGEQPMEEVVTLEEAKQRLRGAIDSLMAGDSSAEVEQALEKWDRYVSNHPDHIEEQAEEGRKWETENSPINTQALQLMKTFVPSDIFHAGLEELKRRGLPPALAKRVFDRKVLWLIRAPKGMISRTHVVELKSKFVANDLDVVESRALHACLPDKFENDADGAKTAWRAGFRKRLQELLGKEAASQLKPAEIRRPVYKDLEKGPFDPDAAVVELETTRSSAFDAAVKLVVAPMKASKISVIGAGLAARTQPGQRQLPVETNLSEDPDAAAGTTMSAPNSPASKYRRKSYALSRGQPTTSSMKNMMSELDSKLLSRRNPSNPPKPLSDECGEGSELLLESPGSAPANPAVASAPGSLDSSVDVKTNFDRNRSPIGTKGVMAELAAEAESGEERSTPSVSQVTPPSHPRLPPHTNDRREGASGSMNESLPRVKKPPATMKDMMAELAAKAKARRRQPVDPGEGATTAVVVPSQAAANAKYEETERRVVKESPPKPRPPVGMKGIMAELAAKARAKDGGSSPAAGPEFPPPQPPLPPPPPEKPREDSGQIVRTAAVGGGRSVGASKSVGMKDVMAELAAKAKAREERAVAMSTAKG